MLLSSVLLRALSLICLLSPIYASEEAEVTFPDVHAQASFPEDNPFHHVVNGERNNINIKVDNKSDKNVTVVSIGGSVHNPSSGTIIKNLTAVSYGAIPLFSGTGIALPYVFNSEFKTGELHLRLWVEYVAGEAVFRTLAFEESVTIVEPPTSIFDLKMISTYVIVTGLVGVLAWFGLGTLFPSRKRKSKSKKVRSSKSEIKADGTLSGPDTAPVPGSGKYNEDWIPEHHLKARKKKPEGALSSGDEKSADSGGERRRGRRK